MFDLHLFFCKFFLFLNSFVQHTGSFEIRHDWQSHQNQKWFKDFIKWWIWDIFYKLLNFETLSVSVNFAYNSIVLLALIDYIIALTSVEIEFGFNNILHLHCPIQLSLSQQICTTFSKHIHLLDKILFQLMQLIQIVVYLSKSYKKYG